MSWHIDNLDRTINARDRVDVENITISESLTLQGLSWVGDTSRINISAPDTYSHVITAGAKNFILEELLVSIDFANVTSGRLHFVVQAYLMSSNGNTFTYTPITPTPMGRATNGNFINVFSETVIESGVEVLTLTGVKDYLIYTSDYFVDDAGNRNVKSTEKKSFFEGVRRIVVPPGDKLLVQTILTGDAGGTIDISSIFFTSELPVNF